MTNPVTCSKCNIFLGNLYFLNSKINSSPYTIKKNKIFFIADDKTPYSYAYCQKCWVNNAINNPLIKQKTDPVIEANYALYLNEHVDNSQNKKELKKCLEEVDILKDEILKERGEHEGDIKKYMDEIESLQNIIQVLDDKNKNVNNKLDILHEKILDLEKGIIAKTEEAICSTNCMDLLRCNLDKEQDINDKLRINLGEVKNKLTDLNMVHFTYVNTIKGLENKVDEFKAIITEKEETIKLLNGKLKFNKKIMKNEHDCNKKLIHKLRYYLSDLNDFITTNMTHNNTVKMIQDNLSLAYDAKYSLLNENEELRYKNTALEQTVMELQEKLEDFYIQEDMQEDDNFNVIQETVNIDYNFIDSEEEEEIQMKSVGKVYPKGCGPIIGERRRLYVEANSEEESEDDVVITIYPVTESVVLNGDLRQKYTIIEDYFE